MAERVTVKKALSAVGKSADGLDAGVEHRFVDFSNDIATWVIFRGPTGGES